MPEANLIPVPLAEIMRLAVGLEQGGKPAEAARLADHVLATLPNHPGALHLKGITEAARGAHAAAAGLIERAIAHGLDEPQYFHNLSAIYERLGRLDAALTAGERAVALDPTNAAAYHNLTVVHARRMELDQAITRARRALSLDPSRAGAHMALAEALLTQGAFAEGWQEYEWRFRLPGAGPVMPTTDRPAWDGAPLPETTLLLVADQGFGDVIQFARYIPWARERCPRIVLAVASELQALVRQLAPNLPIFSGWRDCPPYAAYLPLSGLPRVHGTVLKNIPAPIPYLRIDPDRAAHWRARLAGLKNRRQRTVGLVWAGRAGHPNDHNRSTRLARLAPLFDVPGVSFVALQKGPALAEASYHFGRAPLVNLSVEIKDFSDTAAILGELDLLVTVDTSVAHLAGALGRPVWLMLAFAPDWRWMMGREDSPWYPTARLFRQDKPDEWEALAARVAEALHG